MEVYVVTVNSWYGDSDGVGQTSIYGVYSDRKIAEEWAKALNVHGARADVEDHMVEGNIECSR